MDTVTNYADAQLQVIMQSADAFLSNLSGYIPTVIGALLILIIGLIVAKICRSIAKNFTKWFGLNKIAETTGIDDALAKAGVSGSVINVVAGLVYWIVLLIFISAALEVLGLEVVVETINSLVAYLPQVVVAVLIMMLTVGVGRFVKGLLDEYLSRYSTAYSPLITTFAEILVIVFGFSIALAQLGLDLTFITANLTAIVIGLITTITLSVGLGSRGLSANILAGYYVKNQFKKGDKVVLGGNEGSIKEITSTSVVMESNGKTIVVPHDEIIRNGSK